MAFRLPLPEPRGRMICLGGGRSLHAVFQGPMGATPLVILEAGAFGFSADWAAVQARLAGRGVRSMAYDRAGLGLSPPGPEPRDGAAVRTDLQRLLQAADEAGPFVYCGHSMAGLYAVHFAHAERARLRGVVLVDATTPKTTDSRLAGVLVDLFAGLSGAAAWGARQGLFAPYAWAGVGDTIGLHGGPSAEKRWAFVDPGHNRWAAREVYTWKRTARDAARLGDYDPDLPVAVILAGAPRGGTSVRTLQAQPAARSRYGLVEQVAGANHATLLSARFCEAIVRGVEHVMTACRKEPATGADEAAAE